MVVTFPAYFHIYFWRYVGLLCETICSRFSGSCYFLKACLTERFTALPIRCINWSPNSMNLCQHIIFVGNPNRSRLLMPNKHKHNSPLLAETGNWTSRFLICGSSKTTKGSTSRLIQFSFDREKECFLVVNFPIALIWRPFYFS